MRAINEIYLLAIETSCDDTSIALIHGKIKTPFRICFHQSFSQEYLLKNWGGVVPELAARNHVEKIFPLITEALNAEKISMDQIQYLAVTQGPGLLGPLLTGINTAKALSLFYKIPLLGVNHLFAHLEAIHLNQPVCYPYIGCVISGGHTFFALVENSNSWHLLGSTLDDALGEALDKGGKLLGFPYPAGKYLDRLAPWGSPARFTFPKGMRFDKKNCSVSYSGIKNALRVMLDDSPHLLKNRPSQFEIKDKTHQDFYDLVSSYMHTCFDTLLEKIDIAYLIAKKKNATINKNTPLVFGGGVAMSQTLKEKVKALPYLSFIVEPELCTDNALMIATWAWNNITLAKPYPESLEIDAFSRFVNRQAQLWEQFS